MTGKRAMRITRKGAGAAVASTVMLGMLLFPSGCFCCFIDPISPSLTWSTFLGSSANDAAHTVAVDMDGNSRTVIVGRTKIERRPLIMIEAEYNERSYNIILQNAETIRLISGDEPVSIVDLNVGDEISICINGGGRHFGMKIDETIVER